MATQSSTITVNGKLGNIVGMKGQNGQSYARMRVTPKNPKTTKQSIQRVIFGSVIQAYALVKSVSDHAFEGISYGAKSQQEFMRLNLKRYREYFAQNYPTVLANDPNQQIAFIGNAWYKGQGAQISRGSLPQINANVTDGQVAGFGAALADQTIGSVLSANNLQAGDQITVCIAASLLGTPTNGEVEFFKSRYVVKADASAAELSAAWDPTGAAVAFDADKTEIGMARLTADAKGLIPSLTNNGYYVESAAIIISRESATGEWLRSSAKLVNMTDEGSVNSPAIALSEYMAGTVQIDVASDRYLNNADMGE